MILQALKEYYDRKAADENPGIAPPGWEWKEIPYIIVLNVDGTPFNIEPTVEGTGRNKKMKKFLVPKSVIRTGNVAANYFWDTPEYTCGVDCKEQGKPERVAQQHQAFKDKIAIFTLDDAGITALKKFLELPDKEKALEMFEQWKELKKSDSFHTFKLKGQTGIITDSEAVKQAINAVNQSTTVRSNSKGSTNQIRCLITGELDELVLTHDKIKGVYGCKSTGGSIVCVNFAAAQSFGKEQGGVSPVGKRAASAFATALNTMLAKGSRNRMQVGDASTVFWASQATELEDDFSAFFNESPKDNPDEGVEAVRSLYKSIENGAFAESNDSAKFYVLGLSPNSARISVRFWICDTVAKIAERIKQHFDDMQIVHRQHEKDYLSLFRILVSTAVQGKIDNMSPNLAGETMRAILEGLPYPQTLLQGVIRRIRAEHEITYPRAAIIKACLNRTPLSSTERKIETMLDKENENPGYLLGRLFAALEKIQEEAVKPSTTIRDRFYGAASGTPSTVFSLLLRLTHHHLPKLENAGRRINFERLLMEIHNKIGKQMKHEYPPFLDIQDQGRFAVGYYHQRNDFYKTKTKTETANETDVSNESESLTF